jgi:hypothetical protein
MVLVACQSKANLQDRDAYLAEIKAAQSEVPMPPEATYRPVVADPNGAYQPGSGRQMIEYQAMCAWNAYWVDALARRDESAIAEAERMAMVIRTWDFYTSASKEFRSHVDAMQDAATLGDPSRLIRELELNC